MIEHMILEANLDPNMKVATDFDSSESKLLIAIDAGLFIDLIVHRFTNDASFVGGF